MDCRRPLIGIALGFSLLPSAARAWWNEEWTARKPLRIDTSAAGANITDPIGGAAVLIRLHAGNFRFEQAKDDGSDLRFIAGDDRTPLPFQIEKYDPVLGEAMIWVGLADLKPGAKTELFIYSKNAKSPAAEDPKGTWDKETALVYHFAEKEPPPRDSTVWANHATAGGAPAEGAEIGRGLRLEGNTPVTIPGGPSLAWAAGAKATWSAWIKPAEPASTGAIFSRREGAVGVVVGLREGKAFVEVEDGGGVHRAAAGNALEAAKWHHLAFTAADSIVLWLDGVQVASVAARLPALNGPSLLGGDEPRKQTGDRAAPKGAATTATGFKGELDELQIAKIDRPAGFLQVAAMSQGRDPGRLVVFGQDEEKGGLSGGYFTVIIKSVTLDGWVVIGMLAIMMVVSWLVMITKAQYLGTVHRANERFLAQFREASGDLVALVAGTVSLGEERVLRNSSLHRLWRVGADEVAKRTDGTQPLSAESIESIRASLDAELVRENQQLNQKMVLLTIAISGGPFLGLLGTVVGVMITFAAIAAAGDVNVNAIAPGIAAALVATVAGLAVAIPALFGYNWLLTRVKNVAANQQVFLDEMVTKIAETYSDGGVFSRQAPRARATAGDDVSPVHEVPEERSTASGATS